MSYVDGNAADHMITILGGTGTRLDHMLGTIYAMAGLGPDYPCELVDAHNRVRLLWPGTYVKERKTCTKSYIPCSHWRRCDRHYAAGIQVSAAYAHHDVCQHSGSQQ